MCDRHDVNRRSAGNQIKRAGKIVVVVVVFLFVFCFVLFLFLLVRQELDTGADD